MKKVFDFERLLSANISKKEQKSLTKQSRKLRQESWNKLVEQFNGDFEKINNFLDNL